jgi:hypothetical protein
MPSPITTVEQAVSLQITEAEFAADFERIKSDPLWRISSGRFYKIMIKDDDADDESEGFVMPFRPNEAQLKVLHNLWHRNVIPKARQFGMTTLFGIIWLDHALFVSNQRCGIVAHNLKSAEKIFRDTVKFAYENMPEFMCSMFPLKVERADELVFDHNNSSIQVARSLRSGTTHRLHISEFAKICAESPKHAKEVMTGSIPSVPLNGITAIESTGEGPEGHFYNITMRAEGVRDSGRELTKRDYRLFFFAWWQNTDYRMPADSVDISPVDNEYFDKIEAENDIVLDQEQCAWYVATRDSDYYDEPELMWQEYPSTLEEVFQKSKLGNWFARQMTTMRKEGRIKNLPVEVTTACWTFWDIGNSDGTAVWVVQRIGHELRCIRFYEGWGEPYSAAIIWLKNLGLLFDAMYLPHDAYHVRQGQYANKSPAQLLDELWPGMKWIKVEVIGDITWGIQQTRDIFHMIYIDPVHCKEGIVHLDGYKKKFNTIQQRFIDVPEKADGHSEAADALRQMGQAHASGLLNVRLPGRKKGRPNWKTV